VGTNQGRGEKKLKVQGKGGKVKKAEKSGRESQNIKGYKILP